ncbi:hypothetical protein TVAG_383300 [Trichomonas vaginalis G3]|uniref:Uncharacterized protein n=1 Tax=Trichomonas vaginalis (strain ATCC PRA-98 / G3) TaxID=412133 RepID=A2FSG0_TRIV3|nr:hypothetical protein TVAGG3_0006510 [Trichomonas vaginalis G3]EAX92157.1 hypothetical protein TVAG_383300 [Trichomonas vaginalis G3]KAI5538935.1 hypothetical protein TVAGG3_0006510 [Trichomonas vaginalis G3]|eukprot:XP_001305087.1 hypothetical protein [Trichomonas vaginalis G3]
MQGQWNLSQNELAEVEIIQICITDEYLDDNPLANQMRLLILSHSLAIRKYFAIFRDKCPTYSKYPTDSSTVLIFREKSNQPVEDIPDWCEIKQWIWTPRLLFTNEIITDFQYAITLKQFYDFRDLDVLYFTSFIMFNQGNAIQDNILYQTVPILRNNKICFRSQVQGNIQAIIDAPISILKIPNKQIYVLMPPFQNPFLVSEINGKIINLISINKETTEVDSSKVRLVKLTAPPIVMHKYFDYPPSAHDPKTQFHSSVQHSKNKIFCEFHTEEHINFTEADINEFFNSNPGEDTDTREYMSIDFPSPTMDSFIDFQEPNPEYREKIAETLGYYCFPPSVKHETTLPVASFLSFFRFDFGFGSPTPPTFSKIITPPSTPFEYERLGIPNLLVNHNGFKDTVPADQVITQWESQIYMPISGPKSGHFVVFCDKARGLSKENLESFMSMFCHQYNQLNFGNISEYPKCDPYFFTTGAGMVDIIDKFFQSENVSEFQTVPILSFIFGVPIYDPKFVPRSILTYIRTGTVASANEEELKTLAFVVYSRIRTMSSAPYGMYHITTRESATLFFGFRYQPPFLLPHDDTKPAYIHIAWDPKTHLIAWIDCIGSILQVQPVDNIETIISRIIDVSQLLSSHPIKFTLTILAENLQNQLLNEVKVKMSNFQIAVFSCFTSPQIQINIPDYIKDDIIVFAPPETQFTLENDIAEPLSSCFVISSTLPPYQLSVYQCFDDLPKVSLKKFATSMSMLSWLSVKPHCELRTVSSPPHICALLRKNNNLTDLISRYEFLPMVEKV